MIVLKQLQAEANAMCNHWDIPNVIVKIDENWDILNGDTFGEFRYWLNPHEIIIKRMRNNMGTLYQFYHEIRHNWQSHYKVDAFAHWVLNPEAYDKAYSSQECTIEEDARNFGMLVAVFRIPWMQIQDYPVSPEKYGVRRQNVYRLLKSYQSLLS